MPRSPDDLDYTVIYGCTALWGLLYLTFLPETQHAVLYAPVAAIVGVAVTVGALLALLGVRRHDNLLLELLGVWVLITGPLAYLITIIVLAVLYALQGNTDRLALVFYVALPVLFFNKRRRFLTRRARLLRNGETAP